MPKLPELSAVVISIDGDMTGRAASALAARLDAHELAATWALSDFREARELAITPDERRELALRAASDWLSPAISRHGLSGELARRLATAHALGTSPTTLVLGHMLLPSLAGEVLVRAGFSAVSSAAPRPRGLGAWLRAGSPPVTSPQPLRWGLWQIESLASLGELTLRGLRRRLDAAVQQGGLVHLTIDVDALGQIAERHLERMLRLIAQRREQGELASLTIAGVMRRLADCHQARPAQSILSRAA